MYRTLIVQAAFVALLVVTGCGAGTSEEGRRSLAIPVVAILLVIIVAFVARLRGRSSRQLESMKVPSAPPVTLPVASLREVGQEVPTEPFTLASEVTRIGRESGNDLVIAQKTVSAAHARIEFDGSGFSIVDVGSSNGTRLNGERLSAHDRRSLKTGDRITIDVYEFVFQIGEDGAFEPDVIVDSEVMTTPRADLPSPEAQQLEADSEPEGGGGAESEGEAESENGSEAPTTRLKPVTCPGHPEERATELCTVCKQAFCAQCVIEQDEATVCRSCADVPHSI